MSDDVKPIPGGGTAGPKRKDPNDPKNPGEPKGNGDGSKVSTELGTSNGGTIKNP